jgi:hypothetical protein
VPDLVGIDGESQRRLQACGLNFVQHGSVSISGKGRGDGGEDGALEARVSVEKGVGFGALAAMDGREGSRARPGLWLEEEEEADRWGHNVSKGRGAAAYPFGTARY